MPHPHSVDLDQLTHDLEQVGFHVLPQDGPGRVAGGVDLVPYRASGAPVILICWVLADELNDRLLAAEDEDAADTDPAVRLGRSVQDEMHEVLAEVLTWMGYPYQRLPPSDVLAVTGYRETRW